MILLAVQVANKELELKKNKWIQKSTKKQI